MKKLFIFKSNTLIALAILLSACGTTVNYYSATSETINLGKNVMIQPILAQLDVTPTHVTATLNANELEGLDVSKAKTTVSAKALSTTNADVLVAPRYEMEYDAEKKLSKLTVFGYPAKYSSFRSATANDMKQAIAVAKTDDQTQNNANYVTSKVSNTQMVAEAKVGDKATITLKGNELTGLNEKTALKKAKEQLIRTTNADFLIAENYTVSVKNSVMETFTFTAFPAFYQNYRKYVVADNIFNMTTEPQLIYSTVGDLKTLSGKISVTCNADELQGLNRSSMEVKVRNKALNQYKADVLLNEYFQYTYSADGKDIAQITILGTPAVYYNFHPIAANEVLDPTSTVNADGDAAEGPTSLLDTILNLFKKK